MRVKAGVYCLLWWWVPVSLAVIPDTVPAKPPVRAVSAGDAASWGFGLVIVLGLFFLCIWGIRKLGGFHAGGEGKIRVLGGLSLGMRERVVLLQVGKKQLMLGVTPGRIETLLILEGEDCLQQAEPPPMANAAGLAFAQKLTQALKSGSGASRKDASDA